MAVVGGTSGPTGDCIVGCCLTLTRVRQAVNYSAYFKGRIPTSTRPRAVVVDLWYCDGIPPHAGASGLSRAHKQARCTCRLHGMV